MVNWKTITALVNEGGLGILDLKDMNKALVQSGYINTLAIRKLCGRKSFVLVAGATQITLCQP